MDDLENELFSTALRKINTTTSSSRASRKSSFNDFDDEDPLGDILSSSNETSPRKRAPLSKAPSMELADDKKKQTKSAVIANLFGLDEPEEAPDSFVSKTISKPPEKSKDPSGWLGLKGDTEITADIDLFKNKGSSVTDVLETSHALSKSEKALKDDGYLLSSKESFKGASSTIKPLSESVRSDFQDKPGRSSSYQTPSAHKSEPRKRESVLSSIMSDSDSTLFQVSKPNDDNDEGGKNVVKSGYMPSHAQEPRPRRSTRRRATDLVDPLGLFNSPTDQAESFGSKSPGKRKIVNPRDGIDSGVDLLNPSSKSTDQVLPWLATRALSSSTHDTSAPTIPVKSGAEATETPTLNQEDVIHSEAEILTSLARIETKAGDTAAQHQKILITALALKRQEEALLHLESQQAALLKQHEQQLASLVQRQVQRQHQMIRQQEQIQAHIEALIVQPPPVAPITLPEILLTSRDRAADSVGSFLITEKLSEYTKENMGKIAELEGHIQKIENENADLKFHLTNERQRHEEHVADLETIFKKHLALQDETIHKQEQRHKREEEEIVTETALRISRLKEEHSETSRQQAERMAQLHSEWLADLQRLGEFHRQAVEMLRAEQTSAIEHWKNLQTTEMAAIKEANGNARLLESAVNNLEESTLSVQSLKVQFDKEAQFQKELMLTQEAQLKGIQELVEKQAAALEAERSHLHLLTQDLEARLLQQRQDADDERQRFKAREQAWTDEKACAIQMLEKEKQHLEKLRSEAGAEVARLEQQKIDLATDVARLETTFHLQDVKSSQKTQQAEEMVAEARGTLLAAQEAGQAIQRERDELNELQENLQTERQRLAIFEKELSIREAQVQKEAQRAAASRTEGVSALEEARRLERERTEHATDLAQRLLHLKERENGLAKEKLAVALEWKRIHELRESGICPRCSQAPVASFTPPNNSKDIVDPLPIIMRLKAEQELDYATFDHLNYAQVHLESISQ